MNQPRSRHAAALVVVALALAACGDRPEPRDAAEVAPSAPVAYDDWRTRIPDQTRATLDVALPADGGDFTRGSSGIRWEFCEVQGFAADDVRDRADVSASGPEYGESRDLRVFADDRSAHRFLDDVVSVVRACPEQESDGTTWRHELRPSHLDSDASLTVVQSFYTQDGLPVLGATFWEVVRVGNAVLLTATGGEYEPTTTLDRGIRHHAADVAPIVEAMCVFAAGPCKRPPVAGTSVEAPVVGPHGLGDISLDADENTIESFGGRVTGRRTGSGCRVVDLWVNDAPDLVGNLEPDLGLALIHVRTAGRTDRGVGIGTPFREVVAAYPGGEGDRQLYASDVAGYDDRHWRFWFDGDGVVDEFMLLLDEQHCGG